MVQDAIESLNNMLDHFPRMMEKLSEAHMSEKPSPDKWSKKEILGHLIDSAANNHQRFVRGQFEPAPEIRYDQDLWNHHNYYYRIDSRQLIAFWTLYNRHLIEIWKCMPADSLQRHIRVGESLLTIEFLIDDYVAHLKHHLKQIID